MTLTPLERSLLQLGAVLVVLAAAGVLAIVTNTITGVQVYAMITVIAGGTAVAGGLALTPEPANLIPHLVLIAAVLGLTVALAVEKVFGSTEVIGVFGFILGGGALGAGSTIVASKVAAAAAAHVPPPPPIVVPPAEGPHIELPGT